MDARAVGPLCRALNDEAPDVRRMAVFALGRIGHADAVEPVCLKLSDTDSDVRRSAATVLGNLNDARVVAPLCKALKDPDFHVRWLAAESLQRMNKDNTLPRRLLLDKRMSLEERLNALHKLQNAPSGFPARRLFRVPDVKTLCRAVMLDGSAEDLTEASRVLEYMSNGHTLLRASRQGSGASAAELLRPAHNTASPDGQKTLLRPGSVEENPANPD